MEHLLHIFDWFLYIYVNNVAYLLVYSLASLRRGKPLASVPARACKRFAVLIAAYRRMRSSCPPCTPAWRRIIRTINTTSPLFQTTCGLRRTRPCPHFPSTASSGFEKSTNTKSLKAALEYLDKAAYDVALIIDADNIIAPSYLSEVNDAFAVPGVRVVQTHRVPRT